MKSNYAAQADHSNWPTTRQPMTTSIPSAAGMFGSSTILNNARHNHIRNNTFVTNVKGAPSRLDALYRRAAPNAILNAGGRADQVRCHPGTRKEVIRRIEKWGDAQHGLTTPIFWLSGPAGAGKSAIMQTVAERRKQRNAPQANFFFFRADSSRSHASPLIATLLHQIILLYPSLRTSVAMLLSANPLIFDGTLEDQLVQLIVTPLRTIQQSSAVYHPLILLIDGLDECESETKHSQQRILDAFDKVLAAAPGLFRLLVASRDESQFRVAFNGISSKSTQLYLDDDYSPDSDIRAFVTAQFRQIRKTHPLAHTIDATWPSAVDINYIVEKSSGQFIYAATVMRFISDSSVSPLVCLERVQGASQFVSKSPFSHLDAIYTHILSQIADQSLLNDILSAAVLTSELKHDAIQLYISWDTLFSQLRKSRFHHFPKTSNSPYIPPPPTPPPLIELLRPIKQRYTKATIMECLWGLTSLCKLDSNSRSLLFYHASFSDYLLDRSRSVHYYTDTMAFRYKILPMVWKLIEGGQHDKLWIDFGLHAVIRLRQLPPGLMGVMAPSLTKIWSKTHQSKILILEKISNLCIRDDDVQKFRRFMKQWISSVNLPNLDFEEIKTIRFSHRYFQMARAERYVAPDDEMITALHPETDFDRRELTKWLNTLLHHFYKVIYPYNPKQHTQLLKAWISWAVLHDISCEGLVDLPNAQQYIWWNMTKKRAHAFKVGGSKK